MIEWPNGARCACAITFDIDADSLIRTALPDDGHDRLQQVTMGRYGPTVAMPRILDTYARLGLKQTFFMPAWCMERYPETVEAMLDAGHEVAHHSWRHENPATHSDEIEEALFSKACETHVRMTGRMPRGYRAPVYSTTQAMIDRMIERGFLYDSSLMADDVPYVMQTEAGRLVEMPPHWGNDDWPPFAHYEEIGYMMPVRAPSDGLRAFFEEFDAAYATGGFWMPVLHPFLTGRLARWRLFEIWLEDIVKRDDVWFAPLEDIANHVLTQQPRIEQLPYPD